MLEFCLRNTYFLFLGKYFEQVHGAAKGSPIGPLIAILIMEDFEVKAISCLPNLPRLWLRDMDDTFVTQHVEYSNQFLWHMTSMEPTYS